VPENSLSPNDYSIILIDIPFCTA